MNDWWEQRSLVDDVEVEERTGYAIARYAPFGLSTEGANEREARDQLMAEIWACIAKTYQRAIQSRYHDAPSIKEVMDNFLDRFWQENRRLPQVKDQKVGVILLELEVKEEQ